jgi:hypothetical protein
MNDCSNAEIRDQLPDLLHERLDTSVRAVIVAHVAECVDCRDELELLRSVQKALIARTPQVDIAYVVGALPKAPAPATARPQIHAVPRRRWSDWRVAAAVTLLVAGGSSLAVLRRTPATVETRPPITDTSLSRSAPVAPVASSQTTPSPTASPTRTAVSTVATTGDADAPIEDGPDGRFAGLTDAQMQALLGEIDRLQAVPVTEPDPVAIRVDLKPGGAEDLR